MKLLKVMFCDVGKRDIVLYLTPLASWLWNVLSVTGVGSLS